jgi:hypothetical protein
MSNAARRKGHDFERLVAKKLRDFFPSAATSRYKSRSLDDAGVDIADVPFYIQCKSGYEKHRPKYDLILSRMDEKLKDYPNFPKWIFHKLSGRSKILAVTTIDEFFNMIKIRLQYQKLSDEIQKYILHHDDETSKTLRNIWNNTLPRKD